MTILLNKKAYNFILNTVGKTNFMALTKKPTERKAYLGWKVLGRVINANGDRNFIALRALVPFQHILKFVGFRGNINAYPNKLVWFTFMFGANDEADLYQSCIPEFDPNFRPDPQHINLLIDVLNGSNRPGYGRGYYGWGEAGTGKTSTAHWLLAVTNTACVQLNCKSNIECEEMFVSHTARNGSWTTVDGPILQAVKRNWPLIIDEMDLAPAEFIPALNNLIEGRKFSVTFCDQMIQAGDNFKVIGFGNTSGSGLECGLYNGRNQIDSSSLDRMYKDYYEPLSEEKYLEVIQSNGFPVDELAKDLASFVVKINQSVRSEHSLPEMISPRGLISIMNSLQENTGIVKNPVLYAIGSVMRSILESKEYQEKMFSIYAVTIAKGVLQVNKIQELWEQRYELVSENEDKSAAGK